MLQTPYKGQLVEHSESTKLMKIMDPEVIQHHFDGTKEVSCMDTDGYYIGMFNINELTAITKQPTYEDVLQVLENLSVEDIDNYGINGALQENKIYDRLCELFGTTPNYELERKEDTVTVTYNFIKKTCGWNKFCDVTGANHYAINEFGDYDDEHIFGVTLEQLNKLI